MDAREHRVQSLEGVCFSIQFERPSEISYLEELAADVSYVKNQGGVVPITFRNILLRFDLQKEGLEGIDQWLELPAEAFRLIHESIQVHS